MKMSGKWVFFACCILILLNAPESRADKDKVEFSSEVSGSSPNSQSSGGGRLFRSSTDRSRNGKPSLRRWTTYSVAPQNTVVPEEQEKAPTTKSKKSIFSFGRTSSKSVWNAGARPIGEQTQGFLPTPICEWGKEFGMKPETANGPPANWTCDLRKYNRYSSSDTDSDTDRDSDSNLIVSAVENTDEIAVAVQRVRCDFAPLPVDVPENQRRRVRRSAIVTNPNDHLIHAGMASMVKGKRKISNLALAQQESAEIESRPGPVKGQDGADVSFGKAQVSKTQMIRDIAARIELLKNILSDTDKGIYKAISKEAKSIEKLCSKTADKIEKLREKSNIKNGEDPKFQEFSLKLLEKYGKLREKLEAKLSANGDQNTGAFLKLRDLITQLDQNFVVPATGQIDQYLEAKRALGASSKKLKGKWKALNQAMSNPSFSKALSKKLGEEVVALKTSMESGSSTHKANMARVHFIEQQIRAEEKEARLNPETAGVRRKLDPETAAMRRERNAERIRLNSKIDQYKNWEKDKADKEAQLEVLNSILSSNQKQKQ